MKISIDTEVNAPLSAVWNAWTTPSDITQWNFASDDWCCPRAELDPTTNGKFCYRMEAKDGSVGFDFQGVFTEVNPMTSISFSLGDDRHVEVAFIETDDSVRVVETFDAENEHTFEQQKAGWQSILNNFKAHVESSLTR